MRDTLPSTPGDNRQPINSEITMRFQVKNTITNETATFDTFEEAKDQQQSDLTWYNENESKSSAYDEDDIVIVKVYRYQVYNDTSGHVFGIYEATSADEAIQQVMDESGHDGPADQDVMARKMTFKIHDYTANDGYGYLSIEGNTTYDGDNAWEFDSKADAQKWITDNKAQNWAIVIEE